MKKNLKYMLLCVSKVWATCLTFCKHTHTQIYTLKSFVCSFRSLLLRGHLLISPLLAVQSTAQELADRLSLIWARTDCSVELFWEVEGMIGRWLLSYTV